MDQAKARARTSGLVKFPADKLHRFVREELGSSDDDEASDDDEDEEDMEDGERMAPERRRFLEEVDERRTAARARSGRHHGLVPARPTLKGTGPRRNGQAGLWLRWVRW